MFCFFVTSLAWILSLASATASFLEVRPLSRIEVRRTFCVRVLLDCERRTPRRRCCSCARLLSCSLFRCRIRSRISGSSQMSEKGSFHQTTEILKEILSNKNFDLFNFSNSETLYLLEFLSVYFWHSNLLLLGPGPQLLPTENHKIRTRTFDDWQLDSRVPNTQPHGQVATSLCLSHQYRRGGQGENRRLGCSRWQQRCATENKFEWTYV